MAAHAVELPRSARREQRRSRRAFRRLTSLLALAGGVSAAWWLVAPPALGGAASFAVVDGASMLPRLQRGDLVVLRQAHTYRVGDVVAYDSRLLHRVVLHRIVRIDHGRYVFKGDNNTWLDPGTASRGELIGKRWASIPGGGNLTRRLRDPKVAGALAFMLIVVFGLSGSRKKLPG